MMLYILIINEYWLPIHELKVANDNESRILVGTIASYGEFPYLVSIAIDDTHSCTGFLYNQRWAVTTASCIEK